MNVEFDPTRSLTISQAAEALGISASMLRVYDSCGLVVLPRDARGYRWVSETEIQRIREIRNYMRQEKLNVNSICRLTSLLPCWHIRGCTEEQRESCLFLKDEEHPCWYHHRDSGGCLDQECQECTVYRDALRLIDSQRDLLLSCNNSNT
jgi:MerR family transcriptional regulator, heat shock protein HspR